MQKNGFNYLGHFVQEWGSDHFALVCKLAFAEEQREEAGDIE